MNDQRLDSAAVAGSEPTSSDIVDRFLTDLPDQPDLARRLLARYDEPHRHYHDRRHLAAILDWIERLATAENDMFTVRLAAWFHDAVYAIPPRQVSNEEASARLAVAELGRCGLEQEDLNEIARLIRLTAGHRASGSDPDGALLCDADLAILSGDEDTYRRYVEQVRAEHPQTDDHHFARGRLAVLRDLGGQTLFHTAAGRELTPSAQANLVAEAYELLDWLGGEEAESAEWPLTEPRPHRGTVIHPQLDP